MVTDPLETALPTPDLYTISNGRTRTRINTASQQHRQTYQQNFEIRKKTLENEFKRMRAFCLQISTADPVIGTMAQQFQDYRRLMTTISDRGKK